MNTIMMLKICRELPDMYIMIAFMGSCLAGARAISQDFLSLSVSVSSGVGALRGCCCCCFEAAERCWVGELGDVLQGLEWQTLLLRAAEYPGGSGMFVDFGLAVGVEFMSRTHCGGGGGGRGGGTCSFAIGRTSVEKITS